MRIDSFELIGFKSFSEKTTFNFHPGITCIVGPNGCGKSNIVDAFRWVLGEQSAKSLRGEKMEEVIFNGSVTKKPRGMAEVTMVFSGLNGSQLFSSDENGEGLSDTAFVTRRLYRSGDSEYLLNRNQCRLRDIKELFLDTGLEIKSYSILEQDRITEILNSKPQERRFLIEEVAGVMKYNTRKKEARAKLELSRANLQRITDIIGEVKKQINLIDRLAKKAERYKKLVAEIHSIELKIAKKDFQTLKESSETMDAEYKALKEEESLKRAEYATIESQTETKRIELLEKEKSLEQIQAAFMSLEKEIAEAEKTKAIASTESDNYKEYLNRLFQQEEEFKKRETEAISKQHNLDTAEADFLSEMERHKQVLADKTDFLRSIEKELIEQEEILEQKRREIFQRSEEISNLRNEHNKLQISFDSLKNREVSSAKDIGDLNKALSDVESSLHDSEGKLLEKNNDLFQLFEKRNVILDELSQNREKLESLRETFSDLKEELASNRSRIESLKEIHLARPTLEVFSKDLHSDLFASLSDVIEIEPEYEKAIESALSEKANSFILPSYTSIEIALSEIRDNGLGRTAFVPLSPPKRSEGQNIPEGVIGRASDFVRAEEKFAQATQSLLRDIFIVRDLEAGLNIITNGYHAFCVTIDGEVIEPSGVIIGGEIQGIFKRKREIRELETTIENNQQKVIQLQNELNSIHQLIETKDSDSRNIESTIKELEKELSLLHLTVENSRGEKERNSRKLDHLTLEMEQIRKEKESLQRLFFEKDSEIYSLDTRKGVLEQEGVSLHAEIAQKRSIIETYRTEVTELKLLTTSLNEKIESVNKEKENLLREIAENKKKKEFLFEEISSIKLRIQQRATDITLCEEKIRSLIYDADKLKTEISERKEIIDTENQDIIATEQGLKMLRSQIDTLTQKNTELDIQRTEYKMKIENIHKYIRQNYGIDIETLEIDKLVREDEERLGVLKEKVQQIGPVNLGTIEEYEELRRRYEFLIAQQEDLNRSIAELEEAITKINIKTRKKLREAFEALRSKFSEVFNLLFDGGRADLILTDENNILETGIDIVAQPPRKRLQNINLLSGGEKALTALSLLFASFLIKPTPLCILDEADSALDESNTERFARMLQGLAKDTQFIVVTHNRTTMSIADYLYGITMEESGVSKVISMQFVEAV